MKSPKQRSIPLGGFIAAFAIIGITVLALGRADTGQTPRLEAELGSQTTRSTPVSDPDTSGGFAIRLNAAAETAVPSTILNLTNWKLTLPVNTEHAGNPDQITQPELAAFTSDDYFFVDSTANGVVFRAHAGGATTSNSGYPRSELREMTDGGTTEAAWSNTVGVHTMTIRQAITKTPPVKPHVVAGQIHDAEDDIIMIRLEGATLFVEGDGEELAVLDANYVLGTEFNVKIEAGGGWIRVFYNEVQKLDLEKSGSDWYFKAGCYTQSNTERGDTADAYGEVVIYDLSVTHTE